MNMKANQLLTPQRSTFERFTNGVTKNTGSSAAFNIAFITVIVWTLTGPIFGFSEIWKLVINTGTTIITFLIQKAQNKESMSVQLKLNELIAVMKGASNRLVSVENLTKEKLCVLQQHYQTMAEITQKVSDLHQSHSVKLLRMRPKTRTRGWYRPSVIGYVDFLTVI